MNASPAIADERGPPAPVTIITGGSSGIGRALAFEFARDGNDLLLIARNQAALEQTATALRTENSIRVETLSIDLTEPEACQIIDQFLNQHHLYCRHLVNNAGFGYAGAFVKQDESELLAMLDLNIRMLTLLSHHFLPDMLARREGGILNVASLGALLAGPYQAAYYASKAHVLSLSRALSWECWGKGVRISVLVPGPVRTDFHRRMGAKNALYMRLGAGISAARVARIGYTGYMCGKSLIIPGYISQFNALALKFIPHDLLMPILGWFLRARLGGRDKN